MANLEIRNYRSSYVEGNVIRVAYPEKIYEPEKKEEQVPERRPRERRKAKRISPVFAAYSAIAGVLLMIAVVNCISVQAKTTITLDNIASLEAELLDMQESNAQMETKISLLTDTTYIYNTATGKLGMVPAGEENTIYYERTASEYVIQNEYIPE